MSAVATRGSHTRRREGHATPREQRLFETQGPTLENAILDVWRELAAGDGVTCPVCTGDMASGGRCRSCGSQLS